MTDIMAKVKAYQKRVDSGEQSDAVTRDLDGPLAAGDWYPTPAMLDWAEDMRERDDYYDDWRHDPEDFDEGVPDREYRSRAE